MTATSTFAIAADPVLSVVDLRAYYRTRSFGVEREVRAVDDISFQVGANQIYGLAGESSCGKTTLIRTIAAATRPPLQVVGGSISFNFHGKRVSMTDVLPDALAGIRWKHLSYIMQGSMNVLNPVRRIRHSFVDFAGRHIGRPMPQFLELVRAHLARLHLETTVLDAFPMSFLAACASGWRSPLPPSAAPTSSSLTNRPRRSM